MRIASQLKRIVMRLVEWPKYFPVFVPRFRVLPLLCDGDSVLSAGLPRLSHSSLCFSFYFMYVLLFYLYPKVNVIQSVLQNAFSNGYYLYKQFIDFKFFQRINLCNYINILVMNIFLILPISIRYMLFLIMVTSLVNRVEMKLLVLYILNTGTH